MYNVMLVLNTGEILYLHHIKNVSWSRGRIIFIDVEDKAHTYLPGEIIKCVFDREGENEEVRETIQRGA